MEYMILCLPFIIIISCICYGFLKKNKTNQRKPKKTLDKSKTIRKYFNIMSHSIEEFLEKKELNQQTIQKRITEAEEQKIVQMKALAAKYDLDYVRVGIPENIDVVELKNRCEEKYGKGYWHIDPKLGRHPRSKAYIAYISCLLFLNTLCIKTHQASETKPATCKGDRWLKPDDFHSLRMSTLRKIICKEYELFMISVLIDMGIVETDGYFIMGVKSKGYRFTEQYRRRNRKFYEIHDKRTVKRIKNAILAKDFDMNHRYLCAVLLGKITFDEDKLKKNCSLYSKFQEMMLSLAVKNQNCKNVWKKHNMRIKNTDNLYVYDMFFWSRELLNCIKIDNNEVILMDYRDLYSKCIKKYKKLHIKDRFIIINELKKRNHHYMMKILSNMRLNGKFYDCILPTKHGFYIPKRYNKPDNFIINALYNSMSQIISGIIAEKIKKKTHNSYFDKLLDVSRQCKIKNDFSVINVCKVIKNMTCIKLKNMIDKEKEVFVDIVNHLKNYSDTYFKIFNKYDRPENYNYLETKYS